MLWVRYYFDLYLIGGVTELKNRSEHYPTKKWLDNKDLDPKSLALESFLLPAFSISLYYFLRAEELAWYGDGEALGSAEKTMFIATHVVLPLTHRGCTPGGRRRRGEFLIPPPVHSSKSRIESYQSQNVSYYFFSKETGTSLRVANRVIHFIKYSLKICSGEYLAGVW